VCMPIMCEKCDKVFDLDDGYPSQKWFKDIVICPDCYEIEEKEIERDDEIEELTSEYQDAQATIKHCKERLKELGADLYLLFGL